MRPITDNHTVLHESIKTPSEALMVADVTARPFEIAERCHLLLLDFLDEYITTESGLENLVYDAQYRTKLLTAKIQSISDQIEMVALMLEECQRIPEEARKEAR